MLTGEELGAAIESARKLKRVTKKAMAIEFGVAQPSIQDWVKRGTISKARLPQLWDYFRDVVGPEHWGLDSIPLRVESRAGDETSGAKLSWLIEQLGAAIQSLEPLARKPLAELLSQLAIEPERAETIGAMAEALAGAKGKQRRA